MQRSRRVRVVEIQGMRQRPVQERRTRWRVARRVAEHAGIARRHAHRPYRGEERRRALRVMPRAHDVAHQVQHQEPRSLHHVIRQTVEPDVGAELCEFGGDTHGSLSSWRYRDCRAIRWRGQVLTATIPGKQTSPTSRIMSGTTQKVPHRALITLCVMMGNLMQSLDASIANVSLPYMQGTLSTSAEEITWVLTSYVIAAAIMTAPVGWMAVRFGRKNLHIACMIGLRRRLDAVRHGRHLAADGGVPLPARHVRRRAGAAEPGDDARHLSVRAPRAGDGDLRHGRHGGADHRPDARRLPHRGVQLALRVLREPAVRHSGDDRAADLPAEGAAAAASCASTGPASPCWRWASAPCS